MFDSPKGYHRQLLVGVDSSATDNHDIGYDAPLIEDNVEDMYWTFDNNKFIIQGVNDFNITRTLPLGVKIDQDGEATFRIDYLENIPENTIIFLHDKVLETYHDLTENEYTTNLTTGEHLDRFEISFGTNESLQISESKMSNIDTHYSNKNNSIVIINPKNKEISSVELINLLGQSVYKNSNKTIESYKEIKVNNLNSGAYIIILTSENITVTKKVVID
jgi:hypothetical protein